MEKLVLKQKRLFNRREFELTEKEVRVKTTSLKENTQYTVTLESLGNQVAYHSDNMTIRNVIVGICALIPVVLVLAYFLANDPPQKGIVIVNGIIWFSLAVILSLAKGKSDVHITGGSFTLTLYQDIPSNEEVDQFVQAVIQRTRMVVRNKYFKVDSDLPEDTQMNTFIWLLNSEFISEKEFHAIKQDYKHKKLM